MHSSTGRQAPNMWTILGQTIKSSDNSAEDNENWPIHENIQNNKKTKNCAKCQNHPELRMTEEELTALRIEYVKNQILQKLRLTERPQVSASNIPKPVAEGATIYQESTQEHTNRAPDEFYGKTTQKIIFLKLGEQRQVN